jgi:hypothetical protein
MGKINKIEWLNDVKINLKNNIPNEISFVAFREKKVLESLSELAGLCDMNYYENLGSSRKIFLKPVVFFKKVVRRLLKFLILPAFNKQSLYNYNIRNYLRFLIKENIELQKRIEKLEEGARIK